MAGAEMVKGSDKAPTLVSPSASLARMARRVPSAKASKIGSSDCINPIVNSLLG
jgi:hypothetical protein